MDCEYADPGDILIYSIIDGVQAKNLQEKLLDRGEVLTLADAVKIGQQYEMSQKQMRFVRDEDTTVSAVHTRTNPKPTSPAGSRKKSLC